MTMSRGFRRTLAIMILLGLAGTSGYLHVESAHLGRRLDRQAAARAEAARMRAENQRLRNVTTSHAQGPDAAAAAVRVQLDQIRREIIALEETARVQGAEDEARASRAAGLLSTQRDPTTGLTRIEHFRRLGQGTPRAAFETLIRAALDGDDASLTKLLIVPTKTRTQADALIARLPAEARAQWSAEKLAALWVTAAATEMSAMEITGERFETSDSAVVTFRGPQFTSDEKVNLKLTPEGWKITVGSGMIANLEKKLAAKKHP
jgi:hypothetical protein